MVVMELAVRRAAASKQAMQGMSSYSRNGSSNSRNSYSLNMQGEKVRREKKTQEISM